MKLKIKSIGPDGKPIYRDITAVSDLENLGEGEIVVLVNEAGEETELTSISAVDAVISADNSRAEQIETEIETADDETLNNLETEIEAILQRSLVLASHKRSLVRNKISKPQMRGAFPKASFNAQARASQNAAEKRAKEFKVTGKMALTASETRAALVSSGTIATPTQVGGINDAFNKVSSIVDMVKVEDCTGMGAYKVAYVKSEAEVAEQTEGEALAESDPTFGFVELSPQSIGCISYISDQVQRQSPLTYTQKVTESATIALRVKAANIITKAIYESELSTPVEIKAIDATTLRKIAFSYGGDENVVGEAVLYLNKKDLIAFGDVRGTNEKKAVYEITPDTANPNTGTIKDGGLTVKYCIDSHCNALSGGTSGANTMIYGQPLNCTLALFGDYEVKTSEDFRFDKRLLAVRGAADIDAAVTADGGFVVAKVGA